MAATYTPISLADMEAFLRRGFRALKPQKSSQRGEIVFDLYLEPTLGIRVWSSISARGDSAAGVGEDAIRVQYFHFGRNVPLIPGKAPIVKRTQNWRDSLQDRIEDVIERYAEQDAVRDKQVEMLRALLSSGNLQSNAGTAFKGMLQDLESSQYMALTENQLKWVEGNYKALGLG